jgi:DNA-directed RNA polymerase specialized sigma24 family protein
LVESSLPVPNERPPSLEISCAAIVTLAFGACLKIVDATPDMELADPKGETAETRALVTEAMLSCTSGMLPCLDREQRLSYILGAIFDVSDTVAAEVLEISPENSRQRLARARRDLRNFMNDKWRADVRRRPAAYPGWPRGTGEPFVRP